MVTQKKGRVLVGHPKKLRKPKEVSVCESEDRGDGEGGGVHVTLMCQIQERGYVVLLCMVLLLFIMK